MLSHVSVDHLLSIAASYGCKLDDGGDIRCYEHSVPCVNAAMQVTQGRGSHNQCKKRGRHVRVHYYLVRTRTGEFGVTKNYSKIKTIAN